MATVSSTAAPQTQNAILTLMSPEKTYQELKQTGKKRLTTSDKQPKRYGGCFSSLSVQGVLTEVNFKEYHSNSDNYQAVPHPSLDQQQIIHQASRPHCSEFCEETFDFWLETAKQQQQIFLDLLYSPLLREISD